MKKRKISTKKMLDGIKADVVRMDKEVLRILKLVQEALTDEDVWTPARVAKELRMTPAELKKLIEEGEFFHPVIVNGRKAIRKRQVVMYMAADKIKRLKAQALYHNAVTKGLMDAIKKKNDIN